MTLTVGSEPMRRHIVSTIYNNFIYININLFLANGLARKTKNSSTELLVIIIKKDGGEYIWGLERQT